MGEKGVGFKSVFKVADVVWVSSRDYEFKFDREAKLGMIAPILDTFPGAKRVKWTSFYLELSESYNFEELITDLQSLDARLLIFLRRLRTIIVTVFGPDGKSSTKTLTRTEGLINGAEAVHLSQDGIRISYIVMRHRARGLPLEEKRLGVTESEHLLVFPIDANNEPDLKPQQVFAFLPIRYYGFKVGIRERIRSLVLIMVQFLIQADFLLIASREDVDNSSKWNQELRDRFVNAFLECVAWFNSGPLRHMWPRFLPAKPTASDFFSPLKLGILERLSREPILEAWGGKLMPAARLIYVPEKFADDGGIPLTLIPSKHDVYVSQGYKRDDYEHLELLGVAEMDDSQFLDHLEEITEHQHDDFVSRGPEWHSRLAAVLTEIWEAPQTAIRRRASGYLGLSGSKLRRNSLSRRSSSDSLDDCQPNMLHEQIMRLPLIRLRDGRWVPGKGNRIFFPGDTEQWEVPGGIGVLVADPDAVKNLSRAHFFGILGVEAFKTDAITRIIISNHHDEATDHSKISRQDLIAQIRFLYTTGWRDMGGKPFWFATEFDGRAIGSALYIDDEGAPHSASKYFANNRRKFQFIHPDYHNGHPRDPSGWLNWLKTNMSLSNIPRLTHPIQEVAHQPWVFEMSLDFEFIINAWSSLDALTLLCDNWLLYESWIVPKLPSPPQLANQKPGDGGIGPSSYRSLRKKICSVMVKCTDGSLCNLEETVLPISEEPAETKGCIPLLDVPDPEHSRWLHLSQFGVGVKRDVDFYLRCLESISRESCELKRVTFVYEQIQALCISGEDLAKVR